MTIAPTVSICMAVYNPPRTLFRRQIESIKAQTFTNWTCTVTVDADDRSIVRATIGQDRRFKIVRNRKRLGFYRNFEKALSIAPAADFIALADQDDRWNLDKLESLVSAFDESTQLVYSDCRVVSEDDKILSPTFWYNRKNNFTNLACLVIANTVTGAASMFRASLLPQVLPFPEDIRDSYHDHWIAIVAAANGDIGYIDRPLYDYVQHDGNVIGHNYSAKTPGIIIYAGEIIRRMKHPRAAVATLREITRQGVVQFDVLRKTALFARMALARSECEDPEKRQILSRLARYDAGFFVPVTERIRAALDHRPSLNVEGNFLFAAVSEWAHRNGLIKLPDPPPPPPSAALPPSTLIETGEYEMLHGGNYLARQQLLFRHPLDAD
jgi:glycosyltransferase involved in cell wall biosynthesis